MLRTLKAAGVATAAALAVTGVAATPATASALVTSAHQDCDYAEVDAEGLGYQPGQTIIVEHEIDDNFGGPDDTLPSDTLTVRADGTWATHHDGGGHGTTYYVTVKNTQGTVLGSDYSYCGIW
ncbi:hypothetical protein [Streptomyces sp. DSM 40750]|uniref:hypothetical protein n=1 Tax=Streptomyces sp. DSM 40750 TaxID=2801030 RepID=UPI00214AAB2E|nr:hypothetical protein [Streptomyces sp. DSM 40750]UUU22862.1 hypothetical protein JIX55_22630 [Streptomyces sp. DSM 40750]